MPHRHPQLQSAQTPKHGQTNQLYLCHPPKPCPPHPCLSPCGMLPHHTGEVRSAGHVLPKHESTHALSLPRLPPCKLKTKKSFPPHPFRLCPCPHLLPCGCCTNKLFKTKKCSRRPHYKRLSPNPLSHLPMPCPHPHLQPSGCRTTAQSPRRRAWRLTQFLAEHPIQQTQAPVVRRSR